VIDAILADTLHTEVSLEPPVELAGAIEYTRALVGALPEATIFLVGPEGIVWLAEGRLLSRPPDRLVGRPLSDIVPAAQATHLRRRVDAALRGERQRFEYLTAGRRTACWIELTPLKLGREEPVAVAAVVRDLTERLKITAELEASERARSEFESLFTQGFDASPIGMALVTPHEKRFMRVNDALCRLLHRSREELIGMLCAQVTHPEDEVADEQARAAMVAGSETGYECEKRYVRPDGTVVWGSLHVTPVFSPEGAVRLFFAQIVDQTARHEREQALIREAAELECLAMIRAALSAGRLCLHAQPIVELATRKVVQHELLLRLIREDGTLMPPADFLPIAERHGHITEIDQWVVRQAVELAASGRPVEVNLSAASVGDPETLATIRALLRESGADPSLLVFEVTETALMADVERGRAFAAALRDLGCRFALDDFGTGYGTFTYLKHLPIDYLKIDMEFVRDLTCNEADQRLLRVIVSVARELGKQTIAEGVEDEATLVRLRELGVDHAQGFHLGRPGPLPDLPPVAKRQDLAA
jgi:PAS domain S-box-containing protein